MAPCEECGYEWESLDRGEILPEIATLASEHALLLTSVPADLLREHTRPGSWSPLEYACHVRDVLRFQRERIALAQAEDTPEFAPMRRDERAVEERYNDQDPFIVSGEITIAARQLVGTLAALDDKGWLRTGLYPFPDPRVRTVEWVGCVTVHELAHHLFDIRELLALARLPSLQLRFRWRWRPPRSGPDARHGSDDRTAKARSRAAAPRSAASRPARPPGPGSSTPDQAASSGEPP